MKKIVSVLSAAGLALSLAACAPTTKTSEYRPMTTGTPNTTVGYGTTSNNTTGYGTMYNNTTGYGTTSHNNALYPAGDGRYDTYRNGVIKDQTNYGTSGINTRLDDHGTKRYGVNVNDQNSYSTKNYGGVRQHSIYKPKEIAQSNTGPTKRPDIGLARLGAHQTGTGGAHKDTGVYNYNVLNPNGVDIFFPRVQSTVNTATPNVYVDRQMLASACANVSKQIPGVKNTTVLTTGNQIFVGCDTSGQTPAQAAKTLKKVQTSCENISPRYYKVYTTNDQNTINKVYNNASQMTNKTDSEFEKMIGHRPGSMFHLSSKGHTTKLK